MNRPTATMSTSPITITTTRYAGYRNAPSPRAPVTDTVGGEQRVERRPIEDRTEHGDPQQQPGRQDADDRDGQGEPEAAHADDEREPDAVGAEHVQLAVRHVDEVHDAPHQRDAGGDEGEDDAERQAVGELQQEDVERHSVANPYSRAALPWVIFRLSSSGTPSRIRSRILRERGKVDSVCG